ncbi:2-oxo acid dehydrogenase subunit E2 [Roseobacter sp. YSTF-M11]|uniref:Dihydrolipoyllysine-residue acetyltransferase component of pyruvate dehydrogenase complex n=1 Tax=Roseobacter insulae TaxID=2859783 RepID=A0A9X1JWP3_9RHOB|nr:2-oxo acid dehydrogenase subunit E2 [Roseobacter insulae]MBW4706380.1 2-oxo acid dehydrogenase subunit E2 [Roseobacter insulae]
MSNVIASPTTRRMAREMNVDIQQLADRLGRQTMGPEDLINSGAVRGNTDHGYWDIDHSEYGPVRHEPMTRIAKLAARNLAAAHRHIPAVTHHDQADVSALQELRKSWAPEANAQGVKLTALSFYVAALARCLRVFPNFNASLSPDEETLTFKEYIHVGIAVDTSHGLLVPVIRDADCKGLLQIAAEISDLAKRAHDRKLPPSDMGGASMSISNLGGIGGTAFTPIVNPPEVAILGITRTKTVTAWDGNVPKPVPVVPLDLSYDHRVINGADAARFLAHFGQLISDPRNFLI